MVYDEYQPTELLARLVEKLPERGCDKVMLK